MEEVELHNSSNNDKVTRVAVSATRSVLSLAESQSAIISRNRLATIFKEIGDSVRLKPSGRFDRCFNELNSLLDETYGLKLQGLSEKRANTGGSGTTTAKSMTQASNDSENISVTSRAQHFLLVSTLPRGPAAFETLLFKETSQIYDGCVTDGEYTGDLFDNVALNDVSQQFSTDVKLAMQGLTLVVIVLVLLSKNNILHNELLAHLATFGVPTDGQRIPILEIPVDEFLKRLDKQEYITSTQERAQDGSETVVMYRLGRRAQLEFDKQALVSVCRDLFRGSQDQDNLEEMINSSIGDAYKT
ncbi:LAMI_0D03818g1_1 [Lachancea mirantina]|uniref:LAMI_0D03818g1_1 n=1 Tax=Lachancea mirantina TaxID=1230905 RepID=A0A1G4J9X0_9SACH|nr:LAMI_0D03818g1_1 [Lachancea mirantina]